MGKRRLKILFLYIKVRKNQSGQSRMDNPETLATVGTQDT
jgi:hypothetical protein